MTVYSVGGADVSGGGTSEVLAREVDVLRAERDSARAALADFVDSTLRLRAKHGAHDEETTGQWIARLAQGHRRWGEMLACLREHGHARGAGPLRGTR